MKLRVIKAVAPAKLLKASVHRSGRIGFMVETAKTFSIESGKSIELAVDDDNPDDTSIYGILYDELKEGAFKVIKIGGYCSLDAKSFLDTAKISYQNGDIEYVLTKINNYGEDIIKFTPRTRKPRNKKSKD